MDLKKLEEKLKELSPEQRKTLSNDVGLKIAKMMKSLIKRANKTFEDHDLPFKIRIVYDIQPLDE